MSDTYNRGLFRLAGFDWESDPRFIGVLLVKNTYVFSRLHNTLADVVAHETSGSGYARQGVSAGSRTIIEDDIGNAAALQVADGAVEWPHIWAGSDLRVVLFFVGSGLSDNASDLLAYIDSGTNIPCSTNGGRLTLNFGSGGAIRYEP